ncbi:Uncharacterised protein [Mycobacteroides abscessus subsp. abscessus]|nr:Uncharacterised protein [Mycobacteroides abscessus subsp. abscessus]
MIETDQDRHLNDERETACQRVDAMLLEKSHGFLLQLLLCLLVFTAVFLSQLLHFRLEGLHGLRAFCLLDHQRQNQKADDQGHHDDGKPIAAPERFSYFYDEHRKRVNNILIPKAFTKRAIRKINPNTRNIRFFNVYPPLLLFIFIIRKTMCNSRPWAADPNPGCLYASFL